MIEQTGLPRTRLALVILETFEDGLYSAARQFIPQHKDSLAHLRKQVRAAFYSETADRNTREQCMTADLKWIKHFVTNHTTQEV